MKIKIIIKKKKITVACLTSFTIEELRGMIQGLLNGIAKKRRFVKISNIIKDENGSTFKVLVFYKEKRK